MKKVIEIVPVCALLLIVFMAYANTVDDLDLWWHLESGEMMWETGSVPEKDPFAFTSYLPESISGIGPDRTGSGEVDRFLSSGFMQRNWLSQLVLYLTYAAGGLKGIGVLKSSVFAAVFLVLYLTMRGRGGGPISALLVLCLTAYIGIDFNYTRPQIFSYLFFVCLIYSIYDFKGGGRKIYLLPLLMALWANIHGGVILGTAVIGAFTAGELLRASLKRFPALSSISSLDNARLRVLTLVAFFSALASLAGPSGYRTYFFPWIIRNSVFGNIEEYHRPMFYEYHAYWLMLALVALAVLVLIVLRRMDPAELFILAGVALLSLKSNKYIIYFTLGGAVFLVYSLSCAWSGIKRSALFVKLSGQLGRKQDVFRQAFSLIIALVTAGFLLKTVLSDSQPNFDAGEERYPSGAVSFIKENRPEGNMFNLFNWGGYMAWRLYPEYKVFIYGRAVSESAFIHYGSILNASNDKESASGLPLWKRLLRAYDVNFIVTSALSPAGKIIPLVDHLYEDNGWQLVYVDGKSMIFMRSSEGNSDILHRFYLPKTKIYDEIISEGIRGIAATPAAWGFYETLGFVYMNQRRIDDAIDMFEKYLSMNPYNKRVNESYGLLMQFKGK